MDTIVEKLATGIKQSSLSSSDFLCEVELGDKKLI